MNYADLINELQFTNEIWVLILPLILCVLDVVTGYTNAWIKHDIKSAKMRSGLGKKIGEIVYVVVGIIMKYAFGINSIMFFITFYICFMELVSLAENCAKLGVPMPEELKKRLNNNKKED